jgi:hypothetical protein
MQGKNLPASSLFHNFSLLYILHLSFGLFSYWLKKGPKRKSAKSAITLAFGIALDNGLENF